LNNSTKTTLIVLAVLASVIGGFLLIFTFLIFGQSGGQFEITGQGDKIALVEITGEILSSEEAVAEIKKHRENRSIRAILLRIDSPGGGVVASQEIYDEVRKTRDGGMPVVASMGSVAASGGYYVACGASLIIANPGTLTGSIGVISQFLTIDSLLGRVGIDAKTIKSGKYKDAGSPFRRMSREDQAYFQDLMDVVHGQFMNVVAEQRDMDIETVEGLADGRVFTGEDAYRIGLVDTLGTYEDAIAATGRIAGIEGEPAVVRQKRRSPSLIERLIGEGFVSRWTGSVDEFLSRPVMQYRMANGI
jgi:protease-4